MKARQQFLGYPHLAGSRGKEERTTSPRNCTYHQQALLDDRGAHILDVNIWTEVSQTTKKIPKVKEQRFLLLFFTASFSNILFSLAAFELHRTVYIQHSQRRVHCHFAEKEFQHYN